MDKEIRDQIEQYRERFGRKVDGFFGEIFREVMASGDPDTVALFVMQLEDAAKIVRDEIRKAGIIMPTVISPPSEN